MRLCRDDEEMDDVQCDCAGLFEISIYQARLAVVTVWQFPTRAAELGGVGRGGDAPQVLLAAADSAEATMEPRSGCGRRCGTIERADEPTCA